MRLINSAWIAILAVVTLSACGDEVAISTPTEVTPVYTITAKVEPTYCGVVPQDQQRVKREDILTLTFYNVPIRCVFEHWRDDETGFTFVPVPESSAGNWLTISPVRDYKFTAVFTDTTTVE